MSHDRIASWMTARARRSGHSFSRRFGSYETSRLASRAMSIAANAASAAEDEIAWLMPERCRILVDRQIGLADSARCRARAHIGELMALRAVGDEIKPGMSAAVDYDPAGVDAF